MAYDEGPYAGVLHGPPPDMQGYDDYDDHRGGSRDYDDWADSDIKPKKGNKKNQKDSKDDSKGPVVVKYEGLLLERADAKDGEKRSWGRVIKCKMHFPDEDLIRIVKLHRKQSNKSTMQIFRELESKQQHVVSHAIEERKATELNKNAEWHLVDIQRIPPRRSRGWGSSKQEIEKLQVILKRQPKTQSKETEVSTKTSKSTKTTKDNTSSSRDIDNIIDISEPVNKKSNTNKGNGNKKPKKARSLASIDHYEDTIGRVGGLGISTTKIATVNNFHRIHSRRASTTSTTSRRRHQDWEDRDLCLSSRMVVDTWEDRHRRRRMHRNLHIMVAAYTSTTRTRSNPMLTSRHRASTIRHPLSMTMSSHSSVLVVQAHGLSRGPLHQDGHRHRWHTPASTLGSSTNCETKLRTLNRTLEKR